jgi:hypothetical protein
VQALADRRFDHLVDGLVAEAAASDDVFDRASASDFVDARLSDLAPILTENQLARLRDAVNGKIEAW